MSSLDRLERFLEGHPRVVSVARVVSVLFALFSLFCFYMAARSR